MKGGKDQEILFLSPKIHSLRHKPWEEPRHKALAFWLLILPKAAGWGQYWQSREKGQVVRWVESQGLMRLDWGLRRKDFLVNFLTFMKVQAFSTKLEGLRLNLYKIYPFQSPPMENREGRGRGGGGLIGTRIRNSHTMIRPELAWSEEGWSCPEPVCYEK